MLGSPEAVTGLDDLGGDLFWVGLDFAFGDVCEGVLVGVALGGIVVYWIV
jgi:hypothetical protein